MRKDIMFMLLEKANQIKELSELVASYTPLDGVTPESIANEEESVMAMLNDGSLFEDSYSHTFNPNRFLHPSQKKSLYQAAFWTTNLNGTESVDIENMQSAEGILRDATDTFFQEGDSFDKNWTWDDYSTFSPITGEMPDGITDPDTIDISTISYSPTDITPEMLSGIIIIDPDDL